MPEESIYASQTLGDRGGGAGAQLALMQGAGLWPEHVVDGETPPHCTPWVAVPGTGQKVGAAPKTRQLSHVPRGQDWPLLTPESHIVICPPAPTL